LPNRPITELQLAYSEHPATAHEWPIDLPALLRPEWKEVTRAHHNVLLAGTPRVTSGFIAALMPHLRAPVHQYFDSSLLPASGALILSEVGALDAGEQTMLLKWLDGFNGGESVQVVSTTSTALHSLIESGVFDESLYYRLNVIRFDLPAAR
jgi:sigma54-dependent transcription regulator